MKVVLLQTVPKVGKQYEVKEVSRGFAQNFLFPQKLAEIATEKAMKAIEKKKQNSDAEAKIHEDLLIKNIVDMSGVTIVMQEKANEKGHLFAGVHKDEIVPEIKKQTQLDIDPESIQLEEPIKELGEHEIEVSAHGKSAKFTLKVEEKA
ncbi:50S ribosomal protein L9 [Patescibacteria group bacterium]